MSNNVNSPAPTILPYYLASYRGRIVALERDSDYQGTIKRIQKSIAKLRSADPQDIIISTTFADYDHVLAQVSEDIWSKVSDGVKTIEIALEGEKDSEDAVIRPTKTKRLNFTPGGTKSDTDSLITTNNQQRKTVPPFGHNLKGTVTSTSHLDAGSVMLRTTYQDLISLVITSDSTEVKDVKSTIHSKYGVPVALQHLSIAGVDLDDEWELKQVTAVKGTPMDLVLYTRKSTIYLLPTYELYYDNGCSCYRPLHHKSLHLNLFVNRRWELSAFNGELDLSGDCIQSNSWVVDVSSEATVLDHGSGCEVFWLRWDGSPSNQPPPPDVQPLDDQTAQLSHTTESYRLMFALKYNNSVAVPFKEAEGYIRKVFESLGVNRRELLSYFVAQLNLKPCSYLAIRFLSQTEYQKAARLSIPSLPEAQIIHVVLLYKSLHPESVPLWNSAPPHQADHGAAWQNIIDPKKILQSPASSRPNVIAVDFTFLEVP